MTDALINHAQPIGGLPADLSDRAPTHADIPALVALFNLCDRRWNDGKDLHTADGLSSEWTNPLFNLDTHARVIERDGLIVGYVELWHQEPWLTAHTWLRLHPELEGQGLEELLLAWAEALFLPQAEARTEAHLQLALGTHVSAQHSQMLTAFEAAGFAHVRSFYRMMIDLAGADVPAPTLPEGYTFRTMRMEEADRRAVYTALRAAFADHYGHVERDFETAYTSWSHFVLNDAHFDPALVWVVEAPDGDIAGVSLNWDRLGPDETLGWVGSLGITRAHRRKGIALALLYQGFRQFIELGKARAGLGVDADSLTGATRLYEKAGMHIAKESYAYEKVLRTGHDPRRK